MVPAESRLKRILIIDDDENMRQIYKDMFSDKGDIYDIELEPNAEAALRRVDEGRYDLIILDMVMEPMRGESFLVHLRMSKNVRSVPVLVVSVLSPEILGMFQGMDRVDALQKPLTKRQLFEKIDKMIAR